MGIVEQYFSQVHMKKQRLFRNFALLTILSLLVVVVVSWNLRQTGIAIANDASCGMEEHLHTEACVTELVLVCGSGTEAQPEEPAEESTEAPTEEPATESTEAPAQEPEHVHTEECYQLVYLCGFEEHIHEISCYADVTADLEDWDIWAASIPELTGRISEDIVLVAQSQLGIQESTENFELVDDGQTRNGITRYGQWYGNPYGAWSNMFTSFCLRYAGLSDVPINSGAEKMRMDWEKLNLYRHTGGYEPVSGDIVFLDKNQNGTVESTAVVVRYFDFILTVIEGDVDNAVVQQEYRIDDPVITGYGITNRRGGLMLAAPAADTPTTIGQTASYSSNNNLLTQGGSFIVYTRGTDGKYYAIDGNGNAVEIWVNGTTITSNVEDPRTLYWNFTKTDNSHNQPGYYIQNIATGRYLHPNASQDQPGSLHSGQWRTAVYTIGNGAKFRGNNQDAYALLDGDKFTYATTQSAGSTFSFGRAPAQVTLWLDGTNGNLMGYRGAPNTANTVYSGVPVQLPSEWDSPTNYRYKLAGWVDIATGTYYAPGDTITVTKNTVLYADWVAATYDIGQYNSDVVDTVSTNDFITTQLFDYSALINLNSTRLSSSSISATTHSERWAHAVTGNAAAGKPTLDFSFVDDDWSDNNYNNNLSDPSDRSDRNMWTGEDGGVYSEILGKMGDDVRKDPLFNALFGTGNVVGKHYLGQGDHLFQINQDPRSEFYGYYYYDSRLNAASYNQSEQRFYVYDYLEASSDSPSDSYSDFLPLNSPYANINGSVAYNQNQDTYTYESRQDNNSPTNANWWYGMRTDISFGLPDNVGTGGNKDLYGKDMHFHFAGDDDVWVLIDGELVLDLGGIHLAAEGDINFSTGDVTVDGTVVGSIKDKIKAGEHTLSILYLERGASMGNCAIYFNLAPRFSLTLEKEDVLTQEILNGAQFAVFKDAACTEPCYLWPSQKAYKDDPEGNKTNVFTIENGKAHMWGLSPSETYYLKEVTAPGREGYEIAKGVIQVTLDKNGLNSDGATILPDPGAGTITNGFTVHGFQIDDEEQAAYLSITNAQNWIKTTTSVYVEKRWNDSKDHTYDSVTIYLQVTDPDGTVRRIRQIDLSKENKWAYSWTNLPKYRLDPETGQEYIPDPNNPEKNAEMTYQYSVVEAYESGYQQNIEDLGDGSNASWSESQEFVNGETYILKTNSNDRYLSASSNGALTLVDEATAMASDRALWAATVSDGNVKLTNKAGQSIIYSNGTFSTTNDTTYTPLKQGEYNDGVVLSYDVTTGGWRPQTTTYYLSGNANGSVGGTTVKSSALVIKPMREPADFEGYGYRVTNTPLTSETSVKVIKKWEHPNGDPSDYEKLKITVKLFYLGADGKWVDTGRTETIDLKSNWEAVFQGLPYQDANGNVYAYKIEEVENPDWIPAYGQITKINGTNNWQVTLTNNYRWDDAYELPSTGGAGIFLHILCGLLLVAAPLVYGISLRRKYERRSRE